MRDLIQWLFANPLILILVGTWLLGLIGKALTGAGQRAAKTAQELREQQQRRMQQQVEEQKTEAAEAKVQAPPRPRRLTQEEAMAEMRRILQGEPRSTDSPRAEEDQRQGQRERQRQEDQRQEEQRQRQRQVFTSEGSRTATADRRMGQVDIHVDPHVGEAMQQRRTPASGQVGHSDLGSLGGRTLAHGAALARERSLIDVHDIKRMLIMREVLGPPLALRPDWGPGQIG